MQAKAFKSACSCNPGFQVGCRFRAQLPQAIHTISAPSGSTVKIGFQIPGSVCIIVSRGRTMGKRGRREQGRCEDWRTPRVVQPQYEMKSSAPFCSRCISVPVQCVLFSLSGFELWLIQVHLRPCVKYCQIKAQHPFTQQRDVSRKAAELPPPLLFVLSRGKNNSVLHFTGDFSLHVDF